MTSIETSDHALNRDGLHQQVARLLRRQITTRQTSGSRLPNERDLSGQYGVSIRTIREAVGTLVHDGLLERRHGSGTFVADLNKKRHVGILVGQGLAMPSAFTPTLHIAQHLLDWLKDRGLRGEIYAGHGNNRSPFRSVPFEAAELTNDLDRGLVSALVAISANPHPTWHDLAKTMSVPVLGLNNSFDYSVSLDALKSITLLMQRMVEAGLNDLAVAAWSEPNTAMELMPKHILAIAEKVGCRIRPECLFTDEHPVKSGTGWHIVERLMNLPQRPQALILADDHFYREAAMAMLSHDLRIPEDLRVGTILNAGQPNFLPFATDVVEYDLATVAATLGSMITQNLQGENIETPHIQLPGRLLLDQCSL